MAADGVEPRPSPYRWVVMLTFNLTHATGIVGALVLGVLLPSMTADLGLSPSQQGWLGSSTMLGSLVLSIPLGWWLSRYRATWVTTVSLAAGTLFIFMQGLAPGFVVLLVARILFGLAPVAREPARMLLVHQWLPRREIPLFNGILNAIFGISVTGAFVAAPLLLKAFDDNWRGPLYVYGFFSIGLTLLWVLLGRDNPAGDRRPVESQEESPLRSVFRYREPWLVGLGMVGYSMAQMAQFTFWPTFMQDEFGMSLVTSGFLMGVVGIVVAVGGFVMLPVMKKAGGYKIPLVVMGVVIAATSISQLLTDWIPALVLMFIVGGLARGAFWIPFTTIPFQLSGIRPREMAVIQALMFTMFWAGGIMGPLLVGFLQESTGDLRLAMIVSGAAPIMITVIALLLPRDIGSQARMAAQEGPVAG